MAFTNSYRIDLRELNFLLWEQFDIEETLLSSKLNPDYTKSFIQQLLFHARDFAYKELGPAYQQSDREGCYIQSNGKVKIPSCFHDIWSKYTQAQWGRLSAPIEHEGLAAPYIISQMVNEIFMGANPSFMIYSGFCSPAMYLIERFGTADLKSKFSRQLATNESSACLCMTEPQAGTDVGALTTKATRQDDGSYRISGGKIFISAGMHELTSNIIYIVLARIEGASTGTLGLSCFVVPRFDELPDGSFTDNFVRCVRLEDKMGLHGCATAQLAFGEQGDCRGYLLGERENIGLRQLSSMMNMARISTGIYALGLASRAYMSAAEYANERIQGTDFKQMFNRNAEKVSILSHVDVRRMLLEMKSKVEGCRALVVKLTYHQSLVINLEVTKAQGMELPSDFEHQLWYHQSFVNLLTPIVKAYTSDQAWRIAEQAIQVYGGHGYIKDHSVEQVARDVKILSIWEGTNFIQSAGLLREQLAMGRHSKLLLLFQTEVSASIDKYRKMAVMPKETNAVAEALELFIATHALMGRWVREQKMELIFGVSTRVLEMMAEVTLSWLLLDAAIIAKTKLSELKDPDDEAFYKGKIASATFYIRNILPGVKSKAEIIAAEDDSAAIAEPDIFLSRSNLYA
jgi:alkylation response protein AidB-like acyl-CoA dehydrogenase